MSTYDLVVIGCRIVGLTAARTANRFGVRTLLVEQASLHVQATELGVRPDGSEAR